DADNGLKITELVANGSAEKAGLKAGDLVTTINDKPIRSRADLMGQLTGKANEDVLKVVIKRGEETKTVDVILLPVLPDRPYGGGQLGGTRENVQDQQGPDGFQSGGLFKSADGGES